MDVEKQIHGEHVHDAHLKLVSGGQGIVGTKSVTRAHVDLVTGGQGVVAPKGTDCSVGVVHGGVGIDVDKLEGTTTVGDIDGGGIAIRTSCGAHYSLGNISGSVGVAYSIPEDWSGPFVMPGVTWGSLTDHSCAYNLCAPVDFVIPYVTTKDVTDATLFRLTKTNLQVSGWITMDNVKTGDVPLILMKDSVLRLKKGIKFRSVVGVPGICVSGGKLIIEGDIVAARAEDCPILEKMVKGNNIEFLGRVRHDPDAFSVLGKRKRESDDEDEPPAKRVRAE